MPIQTKPLTETADQDFDAKKLPENYFVDKGLATDGEKDVQLQETIWDFLLSMPQIDISEIELDICDGAVTLMGTFPNAQIQGRVLHYLMNLEGVHQVENQTHVLSKYHQMDSPDHS